MAAIENSTLTEITKRLYPVDQIEMLVNLTYPVLEKCAMKRYDNLGGSGFYFPVRTKGSYSHAYISDAGNLPTASQTEVKQAVVVPTVHVGLVEMTGLTMAITANNAMAFAQVYEENLRQTIEAMSAYKEGAFFRDGSGLLATFSGDPAATVGPHTLSDVGFLRPGMKVDIIDAGDDTRHHEDLEITDVDWVNRTVTFASALDVAVGDTDLIFIAESQDASGAPVNREPIGLEGSLLDSGTYLGIDRASVRAWRGINKAIAGALDELVIQRVRTQLTQETGIPLSGLASSFSLLTHPNQAEQLFTLAIDKIRYGSGGPFDLLNSSEVKLGNMNVITSYNAPTDKAYLGDWQYSNSLYTVGGELHVDTELNGSALKMSTNKDAGFAFVKEYSAFAVMRPNHFARLTGLTEQAR